MRFIKPINLVALLLLCLCSLGASAQHTFQLYTGNGKKAKWKKMEKSLETADVVFVGELHNNPISHWLEMKMIKSIQNNGELTIGMEMIERDNNDDLQRYMNGEIDKDALDSLVRLWPNYDTDYAPLVDYAKANQIKTIGTNVPRRYASMIYKGGFEALDTLPDSEKAWIAPLPIPFDPEIDTYKAILEMMGDHGSPQLVMAQAIKDATMAHFLIENKEAGKPFVHINGAFHSDYSEGIIWYLNAYGFEGEIQTISSVVQSDISELDEEHLGKADFIICIDQDVTTSY